MCISHMEEGKLKVLRSKRETKKENEMKIYKWIFGKS